MAAVSPSPSASPANQVSPKKGAAVAGPSVSTAPPPTATPLPTASPPDFTLTPPPSSPVLESPPPPAAAAIPPQSSPSPSPPAAVSSPPPAAFSPPPPAPLTSPPPPVKPTSPPPSISPPLSSPNRPPSSPPPPLTVWSPPPPSAKTPTASPTPPTAKPPVSPATPPPPSASSAPPPPPPSLNPPQSPPPPRSPPASNPPVDTRPPPTQISPQASPPPPASKPLKYSPPPSSSKPPVDSPQLVSPPPPVLTPSPPGSQPTTPPPPILSPLSSSILATPPGSSSDPNSTSTANSTGQKGSGIDTGAVIVIGVAVLIILFSLIGFSAWCIKKRRRKVTGLNGVYIVPAPTDSLILKTHFSAPQVGSSSGGDAGFSPRDPGAIGKSRSWFTYEELIMATDGFAYENLLGEGGFGSVFKGCLPDGKEIAVKQLKISSGQGDREFKAEVEIISRIHHRHLVTLVGYCISENQRLLVYDFVPNNTLYFHLHGKDSPSLDWATRVKIAAGAARGLAYLHEGCHPRIIHRDIKSSNILLDNNFEARVSDFGLAKLALDANTHITTRVMGTFGYMAPEYASTGKLTEKSDVFSLGVVLLELITGRKPVDQSQPLGDESLVEWARPLLSHALENGEFEGLMDARLEKSFVKDELFRLIEAAAACVRHSAAKRPSMGQVVRAFDTLATVDLTNGMRLGDSEVYNSAQQDEEIRLFRRLAFGSQEYSTEFYDRSSSDVFEAEVSGVDRIQA